MRKVSVELGIDEEELKALAQDCNVTYKTFYTRVRKEGMQAAVDYFTELQKKKELREQKGKHTHFTRLCPDCGEEKQFTRWKSMTFCADCYDLKNQSVSRRWAPSSITAQPWALIPKLATKNDYLDKVW